MADFGIQTFRADGSVAMDGSNKGGIFIEVLAISPSNDTGTKVYSDIPSGCLYYFVAQSNERLRLSAGSDGSGHATLSWSKNTSWYGTQTSYVMVFATKVTHADSFGAILLADNGDMLADYAYPVPQYLLSRGNPGFADEIINSPNGYYLRKHTYTVSGLSSTDNKIVLVNLPESSGTDANTWYACQSFIAKGATTALIEIYVYGTAPQYKIPSIHIFSLDGTIVSGGTFGIQCFNASGTLVYDSSSENVSVRDITTIKTDANELSPGNVDSIAKTMNFPTSCGISAPFFDYKRYDDANGSYDGTFVVRERYLGLMQRKGTTLYYQNKLVDGVQGGGSNAKYLSAHGSVEGGGCMIVDISRFNPTMVTPP